MIFTGTAETRSGCASVRNIVVVVVGGKERICLQEAEVGVVALR